MLIDWFTVVAQIINFLILVFLLWRFLYQPITRTMVERQNRINTRWQEAEEKQAIAAAEAQLYRQKQEDFNTQSTRMIAEAEEKAKSEYQKLIKQARQEVDQIKTGWHKSFEDEKNDVLASLRQQIKQQTYLITRRVLLDLANLNLEEQIINIFIQKLQTLNQKQIQEITQLSAKDVTVTSSFVITNAQRQQISDICKQLNLIDNKEIYFTTSNDLICGIKLQLENYQIAWDIDNYLQDLSEQFI
jgi:F-type H+-transporting ATPase subunit b